MSSNLSGEELDNNATSIPEVHVTFYLMTTISIIGQLFTIITYRSIRNKSNKFYGYVAWHAVIGLPWLITDYLIIPFAYQGATACKVIGFINAYTYSAFMLWSSVIAWAIYSSLKNETSLYQLRWEYIVGVYVVAFIAIFYAIIDNNFGPFYGYGIVYCWYKDASFSSLSMVLAFHIPLFATIVLNLYCYIASVIIVRKTGIKEAQREFHHLFLFPFISLCCNSGLVVKKLSFILGNGYTTPWEILHLVLTKGQGVFEALVYGLNKSVQAEIKKVWFPPAAKPKTQVNLSLFNESSIEKELKNRCEKMENML